ncbi:MAG TPA: hypothetical protein VNN20_05570 [Thermodesulfobacteriota bacterium]|nr:hypothetical protein [Thermodesulfobacteriota bacterium]
MIEITFITDKANYPAEQIDIMERIFNKNFITTQNEDLEIIFKPDSPETLIYIKLTKGVIPEILFTALGEDLSDSVSSNDFFNAFISANSKETPSLIFVFEGGTRSFEFKIKSKNQKSLKEGSKKIIEKLLSVLTDEDRVLNSHDRQTFHYRRGGWVEVK